MARQEHIQTAGDWNRSDVPKLWLYHLHYFEDLLRRDADEWRVRHAALVTRWMQENPPVSGVGWDPYPISLRTVFWIKWALSGGKPDKAMLDSLVLQVRHLENNLEFHLLGNHLWANAKALFVAGLFFEGPEADRWYRKGLHLLERERGEQILTDGGHFERSPAYHVLILEDVLDLLLISHAYCRPLGDEWAACARKMLRWLEVMTREDGNIVAWNDAGTNAVPSAKIVIDYAQRLGVDRPGIDDAITHLDDTGYIRAAHGRFTLWFDVGPIGPDYIPGHAHADSLNIEITSGGMPLVVDTGTSTYDTTPRRSYERGTSAHNCVTLDNDVDSSEMWGSFRVGHRARTTVIALGSESLCAEHDGYQRFGVVHRRTVSMARDSILTVIDELKGKSTAGTLRFHLAPGVSAMVSGSTVVTSLARFEFTGATSVRIENCQIADGFNQLKSAMRIVVSFAKSVTTFVYC